MFERLYLKTLHYARHRHAPCYLAVLSFAESAFSPLPPDVLLVPMTLADPQRAWRLALLTTMASVAGGVFGYGIGYFALVAVEPWLHQWGYWDAYLMARQWFEHWGFWAVFLAGFSPIPYKVFTLAAGSMVMNPVLFVLASLIGRGGRFFLVAGLIAWGGDGLERSIYRYINWIGWGAVMLAITTATGYWVLSR